MKAWRFLFSIGLLAPAAALAGGCGAAGSKSRTAIQLAPFAELAKTTPCADLRRRLFVIDESMVLFDRAGNCPDNGYALTLYGRTPGEVLCTQHDSIAGPMTRCNAGAPRDLFETMTTSADRPDLGLGSGHKVRVVPL
jgi:hypothetical protein